MVEPRGGAISLGLVCKGRLMRGELGLAGRQRQGGSAGRFLGGREAVLAGAGLQ